ncbi:MAG TPA: tetratricopeptide repeat protein [Alphaproteobacteria bacterium]|nr:tetratricopeptide repeat protein [Alphaproteobacteria bacterium]
MNRKERRRAVRQKPSAPVPPPGASAAPGGTGHILQQGIELLQAGRVSEAEALYRRVLAIDPKEPDATHLLGLIAHQKGQNETAIELIGKAIALDGRVAAYHANLGEAYRALGQMDDAIRSHRRALELRPDLASAHYGLGTALLEKGSYEEAATELKRVAVFDPQDAEAHLSLGIALSRLGRLDEAISFLDRAVKLRAQLGEAHLNLGVVLHAKGDLRGGYTALARAVELMPDLAEAHYRIARVLVALEYFAEAISAFREAVRLQPQSLHIQLELAEALRLYRHIPESIEIYERLSKFHPALSDPLNGIGLGLLEQGDFEGARRMFDRALALDPSSADIHFNIGFSYQLQGRFEEARGWHERTLALQPDHAVAHYNLVKSRKGEASEEQRREIEKVLRLSTLSARQRAALNFALANVDDELGDYDAAFAAYKEANDLKKATMLYDPEEYTAYVDRVIATFTPELLAEKSAFGSASKLPVFIVGMPRSGTSLVEQIAASHPQVHGAGELDDLRRIAQTLSANLGTSAAYPEVARRLDRTATHAAAEAYIAELRKHSPTAERITDKLPQNFPRIGLIHVLFPKARIVHCARDPLDTCVSCYFQEFAHGQPYAYDLAHLGRHYRDYLRLMAHWHKVLPGRILDIPYEALIADQEAWSRKLISYLDLPWDDRCLAFYEKERLVRTASFWQVRQPIYASSIGRWRRYAKHLAPLFDGLGIAQPSD